MRVASAASGVRWLEELLVFGRALEGRGRRVALDGRGDRIEVAGADLALMLHCREALGRGRELRFLKLHEGGHAVSRITMGEMEHRVVQAVESGQRDELELVAH